MKWYLMGWKRIFDFAGRSRRTEYWMFALIQILIGAVFYAFVMFMAQLSGEAAMRVIVPLFLLFFGIFCIVSFLVNLSLTIRRLHDTGKSGAWYLLVFVPFGSLILLIMMIQEGQKGDNQYGPDPKGAAVADVF